MSGDPTDLTAGWRSADLTGSNGSRMLCHVGAVQQLHRFAVVSSLILKVTLEEERGGRLEEKRQERRSWEAFSENSPPLYTHKEDNMV